MKRLFASLFLLTLPIAASADTIEAGRDIEDSDIQALREWINTKRQVSLKEIGGDLSISGEARTEFQAAWERRDGENQRGNNLETKLPKRGFDIEFNLMLDYRTDRTWAAIKIEFDNDAGVFGGTLGSLALERAYWGVRAINGDLYTIDIEVGRRFMTSVFDSRVQFGSFFDGLLFRYDHSIENVGDLYLHAGAFLINERKDQFGYIGELGLLNIAGTGFYSKYSLIDWDTKRYSRAVLNDRFRFLVSQFTNGYRFRIKSIKKIGLVYSAFLWNHNAERLPITDNKRVNWGLYFGFSLGQLLKQWDWALDANYQVVAAQAFPDFDASGIGLGNSSRSGFYTELIRGIDHKRPTTRKTAGGTTNYRGFSLAFDLLLTDKLDMQQSYVQSISLDTDIGPFRQYRQYELEFIYSW
jgi:hypothetical protein